MKSKLIFMLICLAACIRVWGQGSSEEWFDKGVKYYNDGNYTQAIQWFRKAAEQGHAMAQYNLGNRYYKGEGVTKDYIQAAQWFRKAAEQGCGIGQMRLALQYEFGVEGVLEKDENTALYWYEKALRNVIF
jgi:TPR repeat protein